MLKTTRFFKTLCAVMVVIMASVCIASVASAVNNVDTPFSFNFSTHTAYTDARRKDNTSSCYMNYTSGTVSYIAYACGVYDEEYTHYYDCSHGYRYLFTKKHEKRFMYNYVREDGFDYLFIDATCAGTGLASGVWSPDSVSQSGVLPGSDYIH